MRGNNAPSFGEANPRLALSPPLRAALKLQRDAGKVFTEADDVQACHRSREICRRASFAEIVDFLISIKIFGRAEAHHARIVPKHFDQFFHIICDECMFVARIDLAQFGDDVRIVDGHVSKITRGLAGFVC